MRWGLRRGDLGCGCRFVFSDGVCRLSMCIFGYDDRGGSLGYGNSMYLSSTLPIARRSIRRMLPASSVREAVLRTRRHVGSTRSKYAASRCCAADGSCAMHVGEGSIFPSPTVPYTAAQCHQNKPHAQIQGRSCRKPGRCPGNLRSSAVLPRNMLLRLARTIASKV
ncbi:hypothetical protein P171DRAFT_85223 [Karstenula rhodostoma CBS 690.94]|uniref:Uncharacterized protein n=1 Tax=Karstenula rhodostoma CBS 690.94 TaxID=1392251 RepID=A0A9P4P9J4_9PLEO|nr:hypothetical protein P171DRAFT_85223 [Karstenula rhodostoma CBS 690.94]